MELILPSRSLWGAATRAQQTHNRFQIADKVSAWFAGSMPAWLDTSCRELQDNKNPASGGAGNLWSIARYAVSGRQKQLQFYRPSKLANNLQNLYFIETWLKKITYFIVQDCSKTLIAAKQNIISILLVTDISDGFA